MKESEFVVQRRKECIKMCDAVLPLTFASVSSADLLVCATRSPQGRRSAEGREHCRRRLKATGQVMIHGVDGYTGMRRSGGEAEEREVKGLLALPGFSIGRRLWQDGLAIGCPDDARGRLGFGLDFEGASK